MRLEEQNLRDRFEALKNSLIEKPLEVTKEFLDYYFFDAVGWDDAINHISRINSVNNLTLIRDLRGIESLLASPPREKDVLANLVWEANWVLEDPSDEGAKEWLQKVAEIVREILGDAAPPRPNNT